VKKNLYITGGHGQDGIILSNIFRKDSKYRLNVVTFKKNFLKRKNINYLRDNLQNIESINKIFLKNKPDIILHLASNNPSYSERGTDKFYKYNVVATKNIVESSLYFNKAVKFYFFNSSQIFKKKSGIVDEFSRKKITSSYTKFRIDMDNYISKKIKNYTNLILFNHDSKFRNKKFLLPKIVNFLKKRKFNSIKKIIKENIYGDFSHAEDICYAVYKIVKSKKRIKDIVLSSNKSTGVNDIIFYLQKKFKIKYNFDQKKNIKKKSLVGNNSYLIKNINYKPKKNIFIAAEEIFRFS
jgi:GDP-D-mannose dehydratase